MGADPNWLLSTVVQSTAAIVAIVAGFVISRLLALSAERGGLQMRIEDTDRQWEDKKQNLGELKKQLVDWDAQEFIESSDVLDNLVASEGKISLHDVMKLSPGFRERTEDELQPYWDEAVIVTREAFRFIRERFSELEKAFDDPDYDRLWQKVGLRLSPHQLKIYWHVYGRISSDYEKRRNPLSGMMGSTYVAVPGITNQDEIASYRTLKRDIETLERDVEALDTELSDLRIRLRYLGHPKGVLLGFIVLAYFTLTGIAIPVLLMPFPSDQFTSALRSNILGLFGSGLMAFLFYLAWLIRQLTEKSDS